MNCHFYRFDIKISDVAESESHFCLGKQILYFLLLKVLYYNTVPDPNFQMQSKIFHGQYVISPLLSSLRKIKNTT